MPQSYVSTLINKKIDTAKRKGSPVPSVMDVIKKPADEVTNGDMSAVYAPLVRYNFPDNEVGKRMSFLTDLWAFRAFDLEDPESVFVRISEYFEKCAKHNKKAGVASLAMALGFKDKYRMIEVIDGTPGHVGVKNEASVQFIREAYRMLEVALEDDMQSGGIHPTCGIFLLKNLHGYRDVTEKRVSVESNLPAPKTRDEIDAELVEII